MTTKLFASDFSCKGVTLENGRSYSADKNGFIHVNSPSDVKILKAGGYVAAGAVARTSKYWVCDDCDWEALINHCGRCGSEDLRRESND